MSSRIASLFAVSATAFAVSARAEPVSEGLPCCTNENDRSPCATDSSDVVGYRHCTPYGAWGANLRDPEVFMELGTNMRHFASSAGPLSVARISTPSTSTSVASSTTHSNAGPAWMFDERMGVHLNRVIYFAFDFEFGDFAGTNSPALDERVIIVDGMLSAGAHVGVGPFALRGEVAGGLMESALVSQTDMSLDPMLEARGRVDLWLSPWFTVGGVGGASLIHSGEWMAGLYIGFHTWAYAGQH
jgi:hypothetical protein